MALVVIASMRLGWMFLTYAGHLVLLGKPWCFQKRLFIYRLVLTVYNFIFLLSKLIILKSYDKLNISNAWLHKFVQGTCLLIMIR